MRASDARLLASQWIQDNSKTIPGYVGGYLAGSICWLEDDETVSEFSDIDLTLVVEDTSLYPKPGKFEYHGALMEVSVNPLELILDVESTVTYAATAASIARNQLLDDPQQIMRPAFDWIATEFPRERRVIDRMDAIQDAIAKRVTTINDAAAFHDQMMWVFPAGVTTHLLLAAGLGNPTVRRRFVEVRQLLEAYNESDLLDLLLRHVASDAVTPELVAHHFDQLIPVYDAAANLGGTSSQWVSDISPDSRRISIGGTQDLLDRGYHRETMWWIVATFTRSLNVIAAVGNDPLFQRADTAFRSLMTDLGITSVSDLRTKADEIVTTLPVIREVADRILVRNPGVVRD